MTSAPEGPALSQAGVFTTSREASSLAAPPSAIYNEDSGDRSGLAGDSEGSHGAAVSAAAELARELEKELAAIAETASAELGRECSERAASADSSAAIAGSAAIADSATIAGVAGGRRPCD